MSGFYLTSTAVHTGISAAQESVALFDGIFGSNESSRALCKYQSTSFGQAKTDRLPSFALSQRASLLSSGRR